ncbi:hypothetical protein CYMTET_42452 [Cymbomonas tetramitiformis]|uniref:Uncharacterized protein n=1 Tax=Cymbomonas tetramitiformis TaxID=36881 RepID=A0AAE0C630_9CHLO|nr:hypothetical protein CYMTET_42452 [Cymbomonas tetramitiformis]
MYPCRAALAVTLACCVTLSQAGFDFGGGCEGGGGTFEAELAEGAKATIGTIPPGKWDVHVYLEAMSDVDIQLYDLDDTSKFSEGKAVIAWCEPASTCNIGVLGSEAGVASATYEEMSVEYSGYEGVDGKLGKEYVKFTGITTRNLEMKAFAFEAGTANIHYQWQRDRSECCQGTAACTGSFEVTIGLRETADIGAIGIGKKDLEISMTAEGDLDIQLFDTDDTSEFSEGRAIVAYCGTDNCNLGVLGSEAGQTSAVYKDLTYEYSGYEGDGTNLGNEYIKISDVTNTNTMMKAYAYEAGTATVSYSFYEVPPVADGTARVTWDTSEITETQSTTAYRSSILPESL